MTVFCDNYGCIFIDEDGFCDCDKLNIVSGVCEGSYHSGRNVTENDTNEKLQAENAKLRKLVKDMWLHSYCSIANTREEDEHHIENVINCMRELGIEVK